MNGSNSCWGMHLQYLPHPMWDPVHVRSHNKHDENTSVWRGCPVGGGTPLQPTIGPGVASVKPKNIPPGYTDTRLSIESISFHLIMCQEHDRPSGSFSFPLCPRKSQSVISSVCRIGYLPLECRHPWVASTGSIYLYLVFSRHIHCVFAATKYN